jgi:spore maturation protein CgeB
VTERFDIVILGLSVTSSWGNGHATTYRGLIRGLAGRGYRLLFLERDQPWYAGNRDEPQPYGAVTKLYQSVDELIARFEEAVSQARLVIVGSFIPEGARVGEWVLTVASGATAFYDIDTPVTLVQLESGQADYITPTLISQYDAYLSFTAGPTLDLIQTRYGSPMARPLYCSVDPALYHPENRAQTWDLGYLGTYSDDRQPVLESLLLEPARQWSGGKFAVVGPMYPETIAWPPNVDREIHLSPREHAAFYAAQRFTLNVTRAAMKKAGYSPSVRLFEAGACAAPVISDWWEGLDTLFEPGKEVLVACDAEDTLRYLRDIPDSQRLALGEAARRRVLAEHTPEQRALQLEHYLKEMNDHISAHTPRRNGRHRKIADGLDRGMPPQQQGENASGPTRAEAVAAPDSSGLHQPSGARR